MSAHAASHLRKVAMALCLIAGTVASAQSASDPVGAVELRRDVLAYHVGRGSGADAACAVVVRYFGGFCGTDGRKFTLYDASGNDATFYAVITLD